MDYYLSIFIRNLKKEDFFKLTDTFERFSAQIIQAEKDLILGKSGDINILSCLLKIKENFSEARMGFSRYPGLAKGLSKIAQFGEILISEEIEQQIIDSYEITSLGMLSIEGMSSQILVCKVENPTGEMKFPEQKKDGFMVSRKNEIEALKNLLRVSNAVLVVGPVGSGKTTFFDQLIAGWDDKKIYRTFCPSYSIGRTLKPITDIVTQILEIDELEGIEKKQKIIEKRLRELDIIDIGTSYLALLDFLDLNEEESILEKLEIKTRVEIISNSIAEIVKRISWNKPVVIIIEDIENMDASSVHFIQQLIVKLVEEKVCFIFSSSIAQVNVTGLKEFELRDIEKKYLEQIIEEVTEEKLRLPPTTPFHVLQYLFLFQEEKKKYIYNQYKGEAALSAFSLPFHDMRTVIKRRIELLDDAEREFLFSLAVAGLEINPEELPVDKKSLSLFDLFVERNFLRKHFSIYVFISSLLHDEIYNLVPDKKARHERLADYYRRIQGYEEQAAFHYLKAENHKKAIEFLMKSAEFAIQKGGYESGIDYYNQALDLCQRQKDAADLEILVALNEGLADVYRSLGDEDKALKYYKVVLDSYKEILKE
ncbi:MAG TPA: tetratricopeptide repeat protein [candidate division WOR-3 bacterium]|uniref:Tetratricopeptide repeat protein n=1 Tax=candidate division WOR-3 bacterium TaxID=2052148 RepID=A0A9C9JZP7_UNCW3|nr:tetratricopeptide repeat protein [candidate division WOR-3 bacterium]